MVGLVAIVGGIVALYFTFYDRRAILDIYPQHDDRQIIPSIGEFTGEGKLMFYAINWGKSSSNLEVRLEAEGAQIRNDTSTLSGSAFYKYNYVYDQNPSPQPMTFYIRADPSVDRIILKVFAESDGLFTESRYRFDKSVLVFDRDKGAYVSPMFSYNRTASL